MHYKKIINNRFYDILEEVIPNISVEGILFLLLFI